ncbi:MAG: nitroreductase [Crocinitomicaceae bacterium]|nr:nitroreductase [Crocinitomicaceae bacterium]
MNMKQILLMLMVVTALVSCQDKKPAVLDTAGKNATIETILTRRSIRKYTEQQVTNDQLDTIMKCAIYSPSALNKQSWEIRVVKNPKLLEEINNRYLAVARAQLASGVELKGSAARAANPGFSVFHGAPTLIVLAQDTANSYSSVDMGILTENILLSAKALGLGTCPIGSLVPTFRDPSNVDLLEPLHFSDGYRVGLTIALGYPAEDPQPKERYADKVKIIE